jgi:hypothetical protein
VPKIPPYKAICTRCGQTYFVRVRPGEARPALVTARQAAAADENRKVRPLPGAPDPRTVSPDPESERSFNWFWSYSTAESRLRKLRHELVVHASEGDWLHFRNARFEMAEIRRRQSRLREALELYLAVWYLDLNGPADCWGVVSARRIYATEPFDPALGMTTPVVARWANRLALRLDLERRTIQRLFLEIATREYQSLGLPVPPAEAWALVDDELAL